MVTITRWKLRIWSHLLKKSLMEILQFSCNVHKGTESVPLSKTTAKT